MGIDFSDITFRTAASEQDYRDASSLFTEYAATLDIDLQFQGFDRELETISTQYGAPSGALLLAYAGGHPVACTGIRQFDKEIAELKRMFVKPAYRHRRLGSQLIQQALIAAKACGYKYIHLDTLPSMKQARALYQSFGFYEIRPYRYNPVSGAIFMEKDLR